MRRAGCHLRQSIQQVFSSNGHSGFFLLLVRRFGSARRFRDEPGKTLGKILLSLPRHCHVQHHPGNRGGDPEFLLEHLGVAGIMKLEDDSPNGPAAGKQRQQLRSVHIKVSVQLLGEPADTVTSVQNRKLVYYLCGYGP